MNELSVCGPLAELLVVVGFLRRVVEEAQVDVGLVGEERREGVGGHVERARQHGQHALADGLERLEVPHHRGAHAVVPVRPLVAAAQRHAGAHVGVVGAPVVADEEALVEVRAGGLVDGGGALDALVRREVADVVLVDREAALVIHGHGVELARGAERGVDDLPRHPVAGEVEEAHLLARAPHLLGHGLEPAGVAPERGPEVDDRDGPRGRLEILHRHGLEDVHRTSPPSESSRPVRTRRRLMEAPVPPRRERPC